LFCIGLSQITLLLAHVYQKYATRLSVCAIAVSKSQEFLLKVRQLHFFDDDAYAFMSTFRIFFTTTRGIRLRRRVDVFSTTSDIMLDST